MGSLKIRLHRKLILLDENPFHNTDIILLVENQHGFLIINRINCTERYWTKFMIHKYSITQNSCCSFISIFKRLYI